MSWWDRIVDWGAEAIGYVDEDFVDITGDVYQGLTAGERLAGDVKDVFGFIEKPLKAYGMLTGAKGKGQVQQPFKQVQMPQARSYRQMGFGRTTPPRQSWHLMTLQRVLDPLENKCYN